MMVRTGRAKFQKLMSSMALVAVPMKTVLPSINPASTSIGDRPVVGDARMAIRITPETYSGVAVETIEKADSTRSVPEPSRMPESTPSSSETGTISNITASISQLVRPRPRPTVSETGTLKTVDIPQSPCSRPQ